MGLHFSKEEFESRKLKVLKSMKIQNIDALLMFRQESMYWLTGYDTFGYVFFQTSSKALSASSAAFLTYTISSLDLTTLNFVINSDLSSTEQ